MFLLILSQKYQIMQNDTDLERALIKKIILQISEVLQLNTPHQWQQRDFENVSIQIEEKTGINLSVSTLKRLCRNQFQNIPQKNTLNALAQFLGYKDWYDYKVSNTVKDEKVTEKPLVRKKLKLNKKLIYIPITIVVILAVLLLIKITKPAQSYAEAKFSSRKNVSAGVPNTVIFDYDISMYDFDSAFIQQSWDIRRRAKIEKNEMHSTSIYYYPGFHRAKLLINDQLVKEIPVFITTDNWLKLIQNPDNDLIPVYVNENCESDGQMYIAPEIVASHNIDFSEHNHSTSFYYVNDNFSGDSDNFRLKTRIKNNVNEGALVCQGCEISVYGENGRHFIQVCDPGCIASLLLKFGSRYISGSNNDLSSFGCDMNLWNEVELKIENKLVSVLLNGNEIYKTAYENSNGAIKGISYSFAGSGAIDYVQLFDQKEQLVYNEDFE